MKVTLNVHELRKREYEVEFPIFAHHDLSDDSGGLNDIYSMQLDPQHRVEIYRCSRDGEEEYRLEFDNNSGMLTDSSNPDYWLGRGQYNSSMGEFESVLSQVEHAVNGARAKFNQATGVKPDET